MSQEVVPQAGASAQPKGLLQQMEELMAALNADLSQLDADLSGPRVGAAGGGADRAEVEADANADRG
ncbi:hypothetical protein [Streptomyces sp. NPDC127072]|uniref:hypothetical protein n=1 Tax=Streptomyces sp. NPDC127072 TaxID=3347129 RepID=UPI00366010A7